MVSGVASGKAKGEKCQVEVIDAAPRASRNSEPNF